MLRIIRRPRAVLAVACQLALFVSTALADPPSFARHDIDATATYCACTAFDVNGDGRLDIVSGGFWYAAPHWTRHFLREVEQIRGRFDDYSNLPMDVNGDGWTDLISCNYRSQSIYWVEHPGAALKEGSAGAWARHEIARPGAMETGRLVDLDQDGLPDILPNGVKFAAWWRLEPQDGKPAWTRYDLPPEAAAHGVGWGDINQDGRIDIISPRGWAEAPANPGERWVWHPEFRLQRDAGIPILAGDVDHDGDLDLVWGRGHQIGLSWLEQTVDAAGQRQWQAHVIDTSWSQPHSLSSGDIDGDGDLDLVVGKRYLGHDGKDPGEYDPLVVYWYEFQPEHRTWRRHQISLGNRVGTGLDPELIDLDQDGDLDLLAAGRSGLYWLENLGIDRAAPEIRRRRRPSAAAELTATISYSADASLGKLQQVDGTQVAIGNLFQWSQRRWHILRSMEKVMGPLPEPERRIPLDVEILEEVETDDYLRRRISFGAEPGDRVPAWLLIPKHLSEPAPAMLCLHQTVKLGKGEPAGLGGRATLHYAHELANEGFVCLAPDYPSFGDYTYDFANDGHVSGTMKAVWNNHRAVDLLQTLPEVDGDRIGCIGHSLGGHNALFTAAFDQRIRAVVTSCGFTDFHHYYDGDLKGWTSARYMPRIRDTYQNNPDRMPFDFADVLAAIAPRGVFVNAPTDDHNFDVEGVRSVERAVRPVFARWKAENRLRFHYPKVGHDFPDSIRREAYQWLRATMKGK